MANPEQIFSTYLHVRDGGRIDALPAAASFWSDLGEGRFPQLEEGRLITAFTFDRSWSAWERHPAGEELVMLLSGSATLVLGHEGGDRLVALSAPGEYVLVPPNTWHTIRTEMVTTMLFLTPGAGTEHRPVGA